MEKMGEISRCSKEDEKLEKVKRNRVKSGNSVCLDAKRQWCNE